MKAAVIIKGEKGGAMQVQEVRIPKPRPEELLVEVKASGVNRADIFRVQGTYVTSSSGTSEEQLEIV